MRKILILFLLLSAVTLRSYGIALKAINIDAPTASAMTAAYAVEASQEAKGAAALSAVLSHYTVSGIATTGIFTSKWLEMKALADPGLFSQEEALYYARIKRLVVDEIMPRILRVSAKMIKYPEDALWWGPFLYHVTTDVEERCKQYQLVVTNGRLTFDDVQFLVINPTLGKYFDLARLGDVDWKALLDKLVHFGDRISVDDIKADFKNLGATIAQVGKGAVQGDFSKISKIGKIFHSTPKEIYDMYRDFEGIYDKYKDVRSVKDAVMAVLGTTDVEGLKNLFHVDDYNITSYLNNYTKELQGEYYRQRWYIYTVDEGNEIIADWQPKTGTPSYKYEGDKNRYPSGWGDWDQYYIYKGGWHGRGDQSTIDYYNAHSQLTSSLIVDLQNAALEQVGWDDSKRKAYEEEHKGHTISFSYKNYHEDRVKYKGHYSNHNHWEGWCYRSLGVTVTDSWNIQDEVFDDIFDSQTMDRQTFIDRMESKLKWYQREKEDKAQKAAGENKKYHKKVYKLGHDEPAYYTEADETKLKGVLSVTFTAHCSDGAKLGEGTFSWKENSKAQGSSLTEASQRFAMGEISPMEDEGKEFARRKQESQANVDKLQDEIASVKRRRNDLLDQYHAAQMAGNKEKAISLMEEYNTLGTRLEDLNQQVTNEQDRLTKIEQGEREYYQDLQEDAAEQRTRINTNMQELEGLYSLQWQDDGEWVDAGDKKIFTRHAYCPSLKSVVDYTAELTLTRKPSYVLGIRVHRAILQVSFTLSSNYSSENVIETLKLDKGSSEKQNTEKVNAELHKLMDDYPKCTIDMKYNKSNGIDTTDVDDAFHLLWVSDRLDVARQIEADLAEINAQLMFIEMGLNARQKFVDFLKSIPTRFLSRVGRSAIAQYALDRWERASLTAMYGLRDSLQQGSAVNPPPAISGKK